MPANMSGAIFRLTAILPPLRDDEGDAYSTLPCMAQPHMWDYDAAPSVRAAARKACWQCPALLACNDRRLQLGDKASGVWAGFEYDCVTRIMPTEDVGTLAWAAAAGVSITPLDVAGEAG